MLENDSSLSWTGDLQSDLLAVLTSTLQKMYVESDLKALNTIASFGLSTLADDMKAIVDGTASETTASDYLTDVLSKIDQIYEGFELSDKESGYRTIEYAVSNNGSSNYIVDNVNPSSEEFVVYARIGDTLNFRPLPIRFLTFTPLNFHQYRTPHPQVMTWARTRGHPIAPLSALWSLIRIRLKRFFHDVACTRECTRREK